MIGVSFIELMVLVLLGGSPLGLPISLPPLPEDPVMAQVAPAECLWYLSWAGCATPDPHSKNHTEQLLAEQEVQRFSRELELRLREALKRGAPPGPQAAQATVLAEEGPNLLKLVITRPAAIFVERAIIGPSGAMIQGGAVVSVGDQAEAAKKSIDRIADVLKPSAPPSRNEAKQSGELKLPMPPGAPPIELRWHKQYLVIGVGDGAADAIIKRFGGQTPEWLAKVRSELKVERPAIVHFLNIKRALAAALPLGGVEAFKVVNTLGLGSLQHYASVSGLEGAGAVSRSQLAMSGTPRGLFALLESEPLEAADLAAVPKDATFAIVAQFNAEKALARLIDLIGEFDPRSEQLFRNELADTEKQLGFKVSEDVLQSLGDTWSLYSSPGEGGLVVTGLTAVVPVKDRQRLTQAHDKLLAKVRAFNDEMARLQADGNNGRGRRPSGVEISEFKFGGQSIYFLNFIGDQVPFAPAWCITDRELIVSLFPQMIKARLSRGKAAGSLADVPEVAALFHGNDRPSAVFYQDTRSIFRLAYPVLHMFAAMICNELQQERVDIDISLLPSMAAIEPHLQPGVSAVYMSANGIRWEARQTLPGAGSAPLLLAPAMFFGFTSARISRGIPVDASATLDLEQLTPEGAQRITAMNNLKQIGLALHNFHDVHKRFPVADGAAGDGKPKLSWRVHILPFIEEQALFNEFKLDEPWDSEHNKKLIARMPKVYGAPGGKLHEKHMTNYLTVRGKDTMFPAGEATRLANVRDGTSKTAMVVEVDDEQAVIWTKPDDFVPDKEEPLKGTGTLRNGNTLILFGDGSVHVAPRATDKEKIRALFTRDGGEVFELEN